MDLSDSVAGGASVAGTPAGQSSALSDAGASPTLTSGCAAVAEQPPSNARHRDSRTKRDNELEMIHGSPPRDATLSSRGSPKHEPRPRVRAPLWQGVIAELSEAPDTVTDRAHSLCERPHKRRRLPSPRRNSLTKRAPQVHCAWVMNAVVYFNCFQRCQTGVVRQSCARTLPGLPSTLGSLDFRQI